MYPVYRPSILNDDHGTLQTGNCVYEVDDPNRPGPGQQDDEIKMMSRIAELEGVIREVVSSFILHSNLLIDHFHS